MNRFAFRLFASALSMTAMASMLLGACGGEGADGDGGGGGGGGATTTTPTGDGGTPPVNCVGGVVKDGQCVPKCTPDKCLPDNTCVGNACRLKCTSHLDCAPDGTQDCLPAQEDDTGAPIQVCTPNGKAPGFGAGCPQGFECDGQLACPDGTPCNPAAQCAGQPCTLDAAACAGDPACLKGTCPDGSACTVPGCTPDQCKPLVCLTEGQGDAEAYCTRHDCQEDVDCPGGYFCGVTRDPHEICGSDPKKGNNNFCGKTAEPCIDPAAFAAGGATFFEGSFCLLRKTCLKRQECAPCAGELDCSLQPEHHCVAFGGANVCLRTCATDGDCRADHGCFGGFCAPRFGACHGQGEFCSPCLNDTECGASGICVDATGGQKACFPLNTGDCTVDADCPQSPSGKYGECLDGGEGLSASDPGYHTCWLPFKSATNKFECW